MWCQNVDVLQKGASSLKEENLSTIKEISLSGVCKKGLSGIPESLYDLVQVKLDGVDAPYSGLLFHCTLENNSYIVPIVIDITVGDGGREIAGFKFLQFNSDGDIVQEVPTDTFVVARGAFSEGQVSDGVLLLTFSRTDPCFYEEYEYTIDLTNGDFAERITGGDLGNECWENLRSKTGGV